MDRRRRLFSDVDGNMHSTVIMHLTFEALNYILWIFMWLDYQDCGANNSKVCLPPDLKHGSFFHHSLAASWTLVNMLDDR